MNPYFAYFIAFLVAIGAYQLRWSSLYPPLSVSVLTFLSGTMLAALAIGWKWRTHPISHQVIRTQWRPWRVTIFIYVLWTLDFLYEGGIPLIKILTGEPYNYRLFGFPSVHVFTVTFASFYTIFLFHCWKSGERNVWPWLLINLFAAVLIYSRAMLLFNLCSCAMIYLAEGRKIRPAMVGIGLAGGVLLLYVFGALGTLRSSREAGRSYENNLFFDVSKPTPNFTGSGLPAEFLWGYIYVSSPLANFQTHVNGAQLPSPNTADFFSMINNEVLMDFISKRINRMTGTERKKEHTIPGPFNVSTVYSASYGYLGWYTLLVMAIVVLTFPWCYRAVIRQESVYATTGFAILCTMYAFMFYDNTIRFTGLCLQLAYPLILQTNAGRFIRLGTQQAKNAGT